MEDFEISKKAHVYYATLSLKSFKEYVCLVEDTIANHHTNIHNEYLSIYREIVDFGENQILNDRFSDIRFLLNEVELEFIQRFRFSVIIQAYSLLETELNKWCESICYHFDKIFM